MGELVANTVGLGIVLGIICAISLIIYRFSIKSTKARRFHAFIYFVSVIVSVGGIIFGIYEQATLEYGAVIPALIGFFVVLIGFVLVLCNTCAIIARKIIKDGVIK